MGTNGFIIIIREILKSLLENCKGKGKVSELELYFYLFYFANYREYPNKVQKRNIVVLELKGQIAVSAEDLSQYFKVARNTILARINFLLNEGFIRIVEKSKVCNVYEIVDYGATKTSDFEQLKQFENQNVRGDFSKGIEQLKTQGIEQLKQFENQNVRGDFSKGVEQLNANIEQLNEQLKTQNFEQLKQFENQNVRGDFSKGIEQQIEQLKTQSVEQLYLNKYNNNKSLLSVTCARTCVCEGEHLTDKEREQKIIEMVETSNSFADELRTKCNDLKIPITEGVTLFDKFNRWCNKNRKYHKDVNDFQNHFLDWLVDIHTPTPTKLGVDKETFERLMKEPEE